MEPGERVRVIVIRQGGIAGALLTYASDTASMPPERAARLRALVEASGTLTETPDPMTRRAPGGRDLIEWEITVEVGARSRTVRVTEDAVGPALGELIAFVRG